MECPVRTERATFRRESASDAQWPPVCQPTSLYLCMYRYISIYNTSTYLLRGRRGKACSTLEAGKPTKRTTTTAKKKKLGTTRRDGVRRPESHGGAESIYLTVARSTFHGASDRSKNRDACQRTRSTFLFKQQQQHGNWPCVSILVARPAARSREIKEQTTASDLENETKRWFYFVACK